jgi:predicted metal-dependent phosphoesterase TrpH
MSLAKTLRVELHCHTYWSRDCLMRPERMIRACQRRGVDVLAVTDHNEFGGALELQRLAPFTVIPGEEVKTAEGELIGYFLRERVAPGLPAEETAWRIREQGGVINVPHPFDRLRGGRLRPEALDRLIRLGLVDMLEGLNARTTVPADNDAVFAYAHERGLPVAAGSDAHSYAEIGTACVETRPFDGPRDFVEAVREGKLRGGLSPWVIHLTSTWAKVAKQAPAVRRLPHGARRR